MNRRARFLAIGLAAALWSTAPVFAQTDLRARARQIASEIAAQQASNRFDAHAQQAAIQQLGQVTLGFIDQCDRAARAGTEAHEKDNLLGTFDAISGPFDRIYDANSGKLERLAKSVMDEDGDLEALYETADWKESQALASQALYYLNWLHYYGGRLSSGEQRKQLLEKAERGFSEFAVGDRKSDLITESLLGRGLCHLELGNYDWAVRDFQIVSEDRDASPERRAKARLGMLDASYRSGKYPETIRIADNLLANETSDASIVRYYRVRSLLGAAKAGGPQAAKYRQDAMAAMDQLRRAGPGWQEKVDGLMQAEVENAEQFSAQAGSPAAKWSVARLLMQKNDYKAARPLLEAIVNGSDADSKRVAQEAHYLLGLCLFQSGDYQAAAQQLTASLEKGEPGYGADAAYLRFKALEAVSAKNPEADPQGYEQAMRVYLAQYGDHKSAYEARYRLGEWLQARRQFPEALAEYERVTGDTGFELRARFGALQCRFEILQGTDDHKVSGAEREALVADIGKDLDRFNQLAAAYERNAEKGPGAVPVSELRAKAAVMNAVYATIAPQPRDEQALAGLTDFEKKYPNQADLFPQVVRLRLGAMLRLGRFAQAETEVREHGALLRGDGKSDTVEALATAFIKEGTRRKMKGEADAWPAAQQVALRLYELIVTDSEGNNKTKLTLARLYDGAEDHDKARELYEDVLKTDANSLAALRGLARLAEASNNSAIALGYWQRFAKITRPGDLPWYEASYEVARLTLATGKKDKSCEQLNQLKPAIPGLTDADLRHKLDDLYKRACG